MNDTFDRIDYDTKETATALRKALREAFPGVRFSVRMARGSAYGWLGVAYVDGPTWEAVRAITNGFQSSYFDGMDDGYHQIEPTLYSRPDGSLYEIRWGCRGVNVTRDYSPEATSWAEGVAVRGSRWWPIGVDAWRDDQEYASRDLLSGIDLTAGYPTDPEAAYRERWNR
ncbi:LPD29 domain-containing protein [Aeromicrobium sp. CF4.19]|uniref:LPD29 domain-containing protein n=1 Tax=Aeromicrobium sp. CF4.19 TaxID=3373082 RepID=UPI003EE6A288